MVQVAATLQIGGSEQLASMIGRGLDPGRFESVFVAVGADGPIGEMLRQDGYKVTAFERQEGLDLRLLVRIWRYFRQIRPAIVQTHHVASLIYGGIPAWLVGAKIVHTEHEINTFRQYPRQLSWLRRLSAIVARFVAIDPSIADFLTESAGIEPSRIQVIRNGIDLERFRPAPPNSHERFTIGWLARLDPPKRPDVLIEALRLLKARGHRVSLRVIGPGSLCEALHHAVKSDGLEREVEILGPRTDVAEQLRQLDVYVLVSDAEGLPISVAEAMACGLPVIASAVGGIPTLLTPGVNGLLLQNNESTELADLLEGLIGDAALRARLGECARRTIAEQFDLAITTAAYANLFEEVAS